MALSLSRTPLDIAQALVEAGPYNHEFSGCLLAKVDSDGRIRELGRFGVTGPGPSRESVPLWDGGLVAQAAKSPAPTLIRNALSAAESRSLTPSSDIDDLLLLNGFNTIMAMPIRNSGLLTAIVGLCSVSDVDHELELALEYQLLEALLGLAIRAVEQPRFADKQISTPLLTTRDRAILDCLGRGLSNKEIAQELKVSLATVKLDVSKIIGKLGSSNRQSAAERAYELGLLSQPQ